MRHILSASAATLALGISTGGLAGAAQAQDLYLSLFGGLATPGGELAAATSTAFSGVNIGTYFNSLVERTNFFRRSQTTEWSGEMNSGWVLGVALGIDLARDQAHGPRIEIEEAYRRFEFAGGGSGREIARAHMRLMDDGAFSGSFDPQETKDFDATSDGTHSTWSLMTNVWYDFEMGPVTPFVGGGLGIAFVEMEYAAVEIPTEFVGPVVCDRPDPYPDQCATGEDGPLHAMATSDNSWTVAYQLGAGLGWALNESTNLSAQYRYFGTGAPELANAENSIESHEILFGLNIPFSPR